MKKQEFRLTLISALAFEKKFELIDWQCTGTILIHELEKLHAILQSDFHTIGSEHFMHLSHIQRVRSVFVKGHEKFF